MRFLCSGQHRDSFDSRYFGPVNRTSVLGTAVRAADLFEVKFCEGWCVLGSDFLEGKIKGGARFGDLVLQINRADSAN